MQTSTSTLLEAIADLDDLGAALGKSSAGAPFRCEVRQGKQSLWILARFPGRCGIALRTAHSPGTQLEIADFRTEANVLSVDLFAPMGRWRLRCEFPTRKRRLLHFTTWLTPSKRLKLPFWPRDLYPFGAGGPHATQGTVHTAQRGPRTGMVFASLEEPRGGTFLYVQHLTSLAKYADATQTSPAGRVGGEWPELGYSPAPNDDHYLAEGEEVVMSDAFVAMDAELPANARASARLFLDLLAQVYVALPRPAASPHDWPAQAQKTVRDLAFSPKCTYVRQGRRYLTPYVGDEQKPPESMVQLTACVALLEYEQWTGRRFTIAERLLQNAESFFEPRIDCCVRWLPGEAFGHVVEDGQKHENMDSWYLYHILFNLSRLARMGNRSALRLFRRSLPYAIAVARRFAYDFPIFFDLNTLAVVRGESKPGAGGEHDVAGLYSLIMIHAHELFGGQSYLHEAKKAAAKLEELGFHLGYQMNTTGFAAEALLRLYLKTSETVYLENSYVCLANMFENMWIWEADYGHARHYRTFFGLFPLRDAPYLAAYEELEALAKFHGYLKMGRDLLRPSVRLLIAEYCKYVLDRAWYYFPEHLPVDALAAKSRNGAIERSLAIPLEDLQDGFEQSGQVGQEVYGAGLALVCATRHFRRLDAAGVNVFSEYPPMNVELTRNRCRFDLGGEARLCCQVRLIPTDASQRLPAFTLRANGRRHTGSLSNEGHLVFEVPGGSDVAITWAAPSRGRSKRSRR